MSAGGASIGGCANNFLAQLGDYATVGQKLILIVDAYSFRVDGYFEEISLGRIHDRDPANIKLMGYSQLVRGGKSKTVLDRLRGPWLKCGTIG
jgi:multidrug resistance efflux pump